VVNLRCQKGKDEAQDARYVKREERKNQPAMSRRLETRMDEGAVRTMTKVPLWLVKRPRARKKDTTLEDPNASEKSRGERLES